MPTRYALLFILLLVYPATMKDNPSTIISKVKTDKRFTQSSLDPKNIYAIDVERIGTNKQDESSKCSAQQKQIRSFKDFEKFRVGSSKARQESVYQTLTTLPDREDGIESFKILGEKIMLIMMNGTAYFLDTNKKLQNNPKPIDLKLQIFAGKYKFVPLIAPLGGNAYVATPRELTFCQPKLAKCTKIEGFKGVDELFNFHAYEYKEKQYLFFLTGLTLTTYEVSSNGKAYNERIFKAEFFGKSKVFLEQIIPIPGDKLLLLDFYTGLIQLEHSSSSMSQVKKVSGMAYEQYGCRHMDAQRNGEYIALQCSLTQKTYFILQLSKVYTSGQYHAQQPIFFNQVLTGIGANSQIIMANIFSGVRLFWASTDIQNPYPYDYQRAGSIFLHNAKGSELWTLSGRKVIFICTEDQLRIYELEVKNPEIICYSLVSIKEQYKIVYTYLCDTENLLHLKVCTVEKKLGYEAWEHKQVGLKTTILPLLISSILVLGVGILLIKLYRKYDKEIQNARLKYNSQQQFGIQN